MWYFVQVVLLNRIKIVSNAGGIYGKSFHLCKYFPTIVLFQWVKKLQQLFAYLRTSIRYIPFTSIHNPPIQHTTPVPVKWYVLSHNCSYTRVTKNCLYGKYSTFAVSGLRKVRWIYLVLSQISVPSYRTQQSCVQWSLHCLCPPQRVFYYFINEKNNWMNCRAWFKRDDKTVLFVARCY